jgi:hypothetical protein
MLLGEISLSSIDTIGRGSGDQYMRPLMQPHIYRETITSDHAAGGIDQERVGRSGIIKVNGRQELPRSGEI